MLLKQANKRRKSAPEVQEKFLSLLHFDNPVAYKSLFIDENGRNWDNNGQTNNFIKANVGRFGGPGCHHLDLRVGTNPFVNIRTPSKADLKLDKFSIDFFYAPFNDSGENTILAMDNAAIVITSGILLLRADNNSTIINAGSVFSGSLQVYRHVAIRGDNAAGNFSVYVNGALKGQVTNSGKKFMTTSRPLCLGSNQSAQFPIQGTLDELAIRNFIDPFVGIPQQPFDVAVPRPQ